jgi:hypothetical protein
VGFTSDHFQHGECLVYHLENCDASTRERSPIFEVFYKLLSVCDTKAERDLDKTSRLLVNSNLHSKYVVMTYCLGRGTNTLKMY